MTMQRFVRDDCTMIAAPVQGDVDGIPKGSHATPQVEHHSRLPVAQCAPESAREDWKRSSSRQENIPSSPIPRLAFQNILVTNMGCEVPPS
jgi:hypothetical protein